MGVLDGLTVLRYGHVYDRGGGMEQYLLDLNTALHRRNRMTTIQVEMTSDADKVGVREVAVSHGRFVRVSLFVPRESHEKAVSPLRDIAPGYVGGTGCSPNRHSTT